MSKTKEKYALIETCGDCSHFSKWNEEVGPSLCSHPEVIQKFGNPQEIEPIFIDEQFPPEFCPIPLENE